MRELSRQQEEIRTAKAPTDLTPEDRTALLGLQRELDTVQDQNRAAGETWGRRTSIILIALATVTMAVSLLRAVQLPVISNGLLLGGVFTMVYGVGWIITTDSSTVRFFVMTAALAITLGLGYVRFVRQKEAAAGQMPAPARTTPPEGAGDLERRVRRLEDRINSAADALGRGGDQSS
jgi:Flp pilus assembly protein TadB